MNKKIIQFSLFCSLVFIFTYCPAAVNNTKSTPEYNKSWIYIDASNNSSQLVSGQTWQIPVEYYLDPTEYSGTTTLYLWGTGPWIDTPDGKYATQRGHIRYPGMGREIKLTQAGRGRHVFTFTVPEGLELVKKNNPVFLLGGFIDSNGQQWPWLIRAETSFISERGFFEIDTNVPGNLFTYNEPVQIIIKLKNANPPGQKKILNYKIYETNGNIVTQGQKEFTVERKGQEITIDLNTKKRGVFLIEADIPGWEKHHTTFARIPDLKSITKGRPTRFGMTVSWDTSCKETWAAAQRLGFSTCRRFTRWYTLQPGPTFFNLDSLEKELDIAAKYGIKIWLCIVNPPSFAFAGKAEQIDYRAINCNWDIWQNFVRTVTTRLKGKLYGWEWLNEITPSGGENPTEVYLKMCRIGTETAKAIDQDIITILAGGLFPRSFRNRVLAAGAGKYIDVMPVHYQNGNGILEARHDLDVAGYTNVAVWDDESAKGLNAWAVPPLEELQNTMQCKWVMNQWADELIAGCEKITYFGGGAIPSGSFGYMLDDYSPRPVAATLAVFISKLANAKPLGVFMLGRGGLFHLFERDGKPILLASTYEADGEKINLNTGTDKVIITDYQGNESSISSSDGQVELQLNNLRFFLEEADLDILKAYIVPNIQISQISAGTSSNVETARRIIPRLTMLKTKTNKLPVNLNNIYNRELSGNISIELPQNWPPNQSVPFKLKPGQNVTIEIPVNIPKDISDKDYSIKVLFKYDWEKLPLIEKPAVLSVISTENLGNLITNGDFESPAEAGKNPDPWRLNNKTKKRITSAGLGDGLGKYVLEFENSDGWEYINQSLALRGGQTYLYTAWVRNENMGTGSNMTQYLKNGTQIRLYDVQVFSCGSNNPYWQMFTCRKQMPVDIEQVSFTPVANGKGWAMWDNIRVTVFEGTDYAAEAYKMANPPKIDGNLDEWIIKCPIPLIGSNQITGKAENYNWTPDNLSGIGYLMWDKENLYVAFNIRDNIHNATGSGSDSGQDFIEGDSIILGIDPTRRGADAESRAFAYYLSSASPGGGSGRYTIFRPEQYSGSQTSGHLFKDSSVYDFAVNESQGLCTYELRIPLSEIGVIGDIGTKTGFSIQLNDNDGGGKIAQINWGEGLYPNWSPQNFGMVTFIE